MGGASGDLEVAAGAPIGTGATDVPVNDATVDTSGTPDAASTASAASAAGAPGASSATGAAGSAADKKGEESNALPPTENNAALSATGPALSVEEEYAILRASDWVSAGSDWLPTDEEQSCIEEMGDFLRGKIDRLYPEKLGTMASIAIRKGLHAILARILEMPYVQFAPLVRIAVAFGNTEALKMLLRKYQIDDEEFYDDLHENRPCPTERKKLMLIAATRGHFECLRLIHSGKPEADDQAYTAAILGKHQDVADYLSSYGSKFSAEYQDRRRHEAHLARTYPVDQRFVAVPHPLSF